MDLSQHSNIKLASLSAAAKSNKQMYIVFHDGTTDFKLIIQDTKHLNNSPDYLSDQIFLFIKPTSCHAP